MEYVDDIKNAREPEKVTRLDTTCIAIYSYQAAEEIVIVPPAHMDVSDVLRDQLLGRPRFAVQHHILPRFSDRRETQGIIQTSALLLPPYQI